MNGGRKPPVWLRWGARLLVPADRREFVTGDLLELHARRREARGAFRAGFAALGDLFASAFARGGGPGESPPFRPGRPTVAELGHDLRAALRSMMREPGFTLVAVLTLALGIGSATAVFGIVNQLVLRPLPGVADPAGAAYLHFRLREDPENINGQGLTTVDVDALREGLEGAAVLASYGNWSAPVARGEERPVSARVRHVYGAFFEALGARPSEGRLFRAEETAFGREHDAVILSESFRDQLFGPDEAAAGATIEVQGRRVRVLGVVDAFRGVERGDDTDLWMAFPALASIGGFDEDRLLRRTAVMHGAFVLRPADGMSAAEIEARVEAIVGSLAEAHPESADYLSGIQPRLFPGLTTPPMWRAGTLRTLGLLSGIVALVLLVACANVANLLLFRNVHRRGPTAVRRALGASTGRLARAQLVASLLLAALGSAAGLGVAWAITLGLQGERLLRMPAVESFTVDLRIASFAIGAALFTTVLFGAGPALVAARFDLADSLRASRRGDTGRAAGVRRVMATGQIALSLSLVIGGLLLARTVSNLLSVDTGIDARGVLQLGVSVSSGEGDPLLVGEQVMAEVDATPGVTLTATAMYGPHGSSMGGRVQREADAEVVRAEMIPMTRRWLDVVGVESLSGGPIHLDESTWGPGVTVLSRALAARLFGTPEEAVGKTILGGPRGENELRVVGVTEELRSARVPDNPRETFFVAPDPRFAFMTTLIARVEQTDAATLDGIREAAERALPGVPVADPVPVARTIEWMHSERRMLARLVGTLSAFAALLAGVGLYGIVAFSVAGRSREFGVRMALGAGGERIVALVARYAGSIVIVGTALGLAGGYALSQVLESRLFGVQPLDPVSYGAAVALAVATTALACWAPTRRAVSVDPARTLGAE